jgi:membrane protease subunit HflC
MKTKIALIVGVLLGIAAIVLFSSAYVVKEGQQAIVTEFGKPVPGTPTQVKLRESSDGIGSGVVLKILVRQGDWIEKDQAIVELKADKATVEVPSSHAGRVIEIDVSVGDSVTVGAVLITVESLREAGLHFKSPFIQDVHILEKRLLPWDGAPESMQTKDKKRIDIDVWARWRIIEPMTFFEKVTTEQRGQMILDDLVDSAVRDVVAQHNLIDVVRNSNNPLEYEIEDTDRSTVDRVKHGRDVVEEKIAAKVDLKEYGMELVRVRIKRVNYVESVRQTVYERMISERLRIARLYDSEAKEEENRILGETKKELDQIEGEMQKKSVEIRGKADAEVIRLTAEAYGQSLEFYEFLRRLEVLKTTLGRDTRLILSTKSDLFQLLKEPGEMAPEPAATEVIVP